MPNTSPPTLFPAPPITLTLTLPLHDLIDTYNLYVAPAQQHPTVPKSFLDAMTIRVAVYVHEQQISLEKELDADDRRCWHWTAYAGEEAVGTIRLVPPPNLAVEVFAKHRMMDGTDYVSEVRSAVHDGREVFVKLGRLAVLKSWRGSGLARMLVEGALEWVAKYAKAMNVDGDFRGLVLVHAQIGLQKYWQGYGFKLDHGLGMWDEEGIDHVGMWSRVELV